ncbi:MAG: hypothetical protein KME38_20735 [Spirirestis rafaelensis WJT71-NPBG6]|jgi:hypothetical protein|nr:hypothetical protein [Spirirestis rafaelensis WJT71-NPBG6]
MRSLLNSAQIALDVLHKIHLIGVCPGLLRLLDGANAMLACGDGLASLYRGGGVVAWGALLYSLQQQQRRDVLFSPNPTSNGFLRPKKEKILQPCTLQRFKNG